MKLLGDGLALVLDELSYHLADHDAVADFLRSNPLGGPSRARTDGYASAKPLGVPP
jgi:hypothetical protein